MGNVDRNMNIRIIIFWRFICLRCVQLTLILSTAVSLISALSLLISATTYGYRSIAWLWKSQDAYISLSIHKHERVKSLEATHSLTSGVFLDTFQSRQITHKLLISIELSTINYLNSIDNNRCSSRERWSRATPTADYEALWRFNFRVVLQKI